jgi:hypothetical protein
MAAFDDGTPLDAAALQDLDRRLVELKASIPKIGTAATSTSPGGLQNSTINAKQIVGGKTGEIRMMPGIPVTFNVNFGAELDAIPVAVILTPARSVGATSTFSYAVDGTSLGTSGCQATVYLNSAGPKNGQNVRFFFMAICQ